MMPPPMMTLSAPVALVMGRESPWLAVGQKQAARLSPHKPRDWQPLIRRLHQGAMTDAELLRQIVTALAEGRADIVFSRGLESHMDFPGNSETDKTQFIIAGLVFVGLAYWFGNWWLVVAAVALVVAGYLGFWRRIVRTRMRRRFIAKGMGDVSLWRKCWTFPGIV